MNTRMLRHGLWIGAISVCTLMVVAMTNARAAVLTLDVSTIADPGNAALEGTISGAGVVDTGLSVADFPRQYKITSGLTDLHFDIPKGQVDIDDLVVTQNLFAMAKITKMAGAGNDDHVWIVGKAITPVKWIEITSDVSVERIVATVPLPAALPLFGTALLGFAFVARRRHRAA